MNTHEFEYVAAIAKYNSFSTAAKQLHISQPALSNYITKLESSLGAQLFDRSVSPITITEPGIQYLKYGSEMIEIEKNFQNYLSDYNNLKTGTISIGSSHCFTSCYLPPTISNYLTKYPGVNIKIQEGRIPDLENAVLQGTLDIVITANKLKSALFTQENLFSEELLLAVPANHIKNESLMNYQINPNDIVNNIPITNKPIDLKIFENDPFILLQPDQHIFQLSSKIFDSFNISPNVIISVEQMMSSFAFTLANVGISFITESAIRLGNFSNYPCLYRLSPDLSHRNITIAYKKNRYLSLACSIFIEEFKNTLNGG